MTIKRPNREGDSLLLLGTTKALIGWVKRGQRKTRKMSKGCWHLGLFGICLHVANPTIKRPNRKGDSLQVLRTTIGLGLREDFGKDYRAPYSVA